MNFKEIFESSTQLENNDAILISYYVINYCKEKKIDLTNLKLLKLLYFINIDFLIASKGIPIFKEEFSAWRHGPVLQSVYDHFKFGIITQTSNNLVKITNILAHNKIKIIDQVLNKFANKSAWELVTLTHIEDGPWDKIFRNSKNIYNMSFEKIPHSLIFNYYKNKVL